MIPHLPDEIWLKILRYVPLQHRLQNVQFVDTRFHRLCTDRSLNATLNVLTGLRVSERKGIALLSRTSPWLKAISFKDCHWLSKSFFAKSPPLPSLNFLNFGPCYLPSNKLYEFFSKCPDLKSLVVHLTTDDIQRLHTMRIRKPEQWPIKNLNRIHVVLDKGDTRGSDTAEIVQKLYNAFFPELIPASFSVEGLHGSYISHVQPISKETLDFSQTFSRDDVGEAEIFCENAKNIGIHSRDSSYFDYTNLTFLILPNTIWEGNPCTHQVVCPNEMPNLTYLSVAMWNRDHGNICGNLFSKKIFFKCDCQNLKCLKLDLSHFLQLENFYARISNFTMLEELILGGTLVKLNLLLKYIEPLKQLQSLSVHVDKSIYEAADEETQYDGDEFLTNLYQSHPKMKKLNLYIVMKDHHARTRILKPLKLFTDLEVLKVDGFDIMNSLKFSKVLKNLQSLTSLSLIAQDKTSSCDFDIFLRDSLHLLPRITQLHFQHESVSFFNVLQNCSRCKKLEKLMIRSAGEVSSGALCALKQCTAELPTLEMVVIICNGVQDEVTDGIQKLQERLQSSERRHVLIYCGKLESTPREFHSIAFSRDFSPYQPYHFW